MKRIGIFFDGTWNVPGSNTNVIRTQLLAGGRNIIDGIEVPIAQTNVYRLYTQIPAQRSFRVLFGETIETTRTDDQPNTEVPQVKYYHSGVGTKFLRRGLEGSTGLGVDRNIMDAYLWLAKHYQCGDEVFLFGFSRGAFTARSFSGLIKLCGILMMPDRASARRAWKLYRRIASTSVESERKEDAGSRFKTESSWESKIKFIGVWDTVGALGFDLRMPWIGRHNFAYHDVELSDNVENAYHAMAVDEHRPQFDVDVWKKCPAGNVEQTWFVGSHSNVGGGYVDDELADIPLAWMIEKAKGVGMEFRNTITPTSRCHLYEIRDSYNAFLQSDLFSDAARRIYQTRHPRFFRTQYQGVRELIHPTVLKRVFEGGLDEQNHPYTIRLKW